MSRSFKEILKNPFSDLMGRCKYRQATTLLKPAAFSILNFVLNWQGYISEVQL
jgi:hypothetical protein